MYLVEGRVFCNFLNFGIIFTGKDKLKTSTVGNSTDILWHKSSVGKSERQELLQQKGCVIWITGLSGSGLCGKWE